jgi:hypothetical protein
VNRIFGRSAESTKSQPNLAKWVLFIVSALWLSAHLTFSIEGLRLASVDDVNIHRGIVDPAIALSNRMLDFAMGRIYAEIKFSYLEAVIGIRSDLIHALVRVVALGIAAAAAAWFTWEWRRNWAVSLLVFVATLGFCQIAVSYEALLTQSNLWVGWAAVWTMGALALRPNSAATRCGTVVAYAVALCTNEGNAPFLVWAILLNWASDRRTGFFKALCNDSSCWIVLAGYACLSLLVRFAALGHDRPYDGGTVSLNLREMALALNAYTLSAVPGFESWIDRWAKATDSLWISPQMWLQRVIDGTSVGALVGAGMLAACAWVGLEGAVEPENTRSRRSAAIFAIVLIGAFTPNLLLVATPKYQTWAHQRMWPYYYAAMSTAVWTVLFVTVGASMVMRISHRSLRQAVRGAFALLAALMAIAIGASNREAISLLQRHTLTHAAEFREWLDRTPK